MNLEDQLTTHLHQRAKHLEMEPAPIDAIHRGAKRRSMRTRSLVAACGLVALAGVASFIPTRSDEQSGLIVADPVEITDDNKNDDTTDDLQATEATSPAGRPRAANIISDGNGGFVAVAASTSSGRTTFVASDDGVTWRSAGETNFGTGRGVQRLVRRGDHYVALIGPWRSNEGTSYYTSSGELPDPAVALSRDLTTWDELAAVIDTADVEGASTGFNVEDVAVIGGDIMVSATQWIRFDYEKVGVSPNEICGNSYTRDGYFVTTCDGAQVRVADAAESGLAGQTQGGSWLFSSGGEPFQRVTGPTPTTRRAQLSTFNGQFAATFNDDNHIFLSDDGESWLKVPADQVRGPSGLTVAEHNNSQAAVTIDYSNETTTSVVFMEVAGGPNNDLGTSRLELQLPRALGVTPRLAAGPAGWAVLVIDGETLGTASPSPFPPDAHWWTVQKDGWSISSTSVGRQRWISASSEDALFSYGLGSANTPIRDVELGLFGEARLYQPGTSDLITEVTRADIGQEMAGRRKNADGTSEPFPLIGEVAFDGSTIRGDLRNGPLILESSDGSAVEYSDGFAFTNGDNNDGVELILPKPYVGFASLAAPDSALRFFDSTGNIKLEVPLTVLIEGLDLDAKEDAPRARRPTHGAIWFSAFDDPEWKLVWEDNGLYGYETLAVGDDEVLLLGALDVTRIQLNDEEGDG